MQKKENKKCASARGLEQDRLLGECARRGNKAAPFTNLAPPPQKKSRENATTGRKRDNVRTQNTHTHTLASARVSRLPKMESYCTSGADQNYTTRAKAKKQNGRHTHARTHIHAHVHIHIESSSEHSTLVHESPGTHTSMHACTRRGHAATVFASAARSAQSSSAH
eukprot:EC816710.1.p2 GENE.EC816710.1~~EC816710.1.p2  ORF type:complete len:166 (-),score=21.39 EC816710.1:133-630(-)